MTAPSSQPGRPRVLIPITINFALRYVVRTGLLDQLRAGLDPVLALTWADDSLVADLRAQGIEAITIDPPQIDPAIHVLLADVESTFVRRLASPSAPIDRARRELGQPASKRARAWARRARTRARLLRPGFEARARSALSASFADGTNQRNYEAVLRAERIDAVFSVTPYTVQESVLLPAATSLGLPVITSVLSFDNLTTRPPLPIAFDRYLVWNRFNRDELRRGYPGVSAEQIAVVGPAQFDFYGDPRFVADAATWRADIGLAPGAPTILFGAGPPSVSPYEDQYVDDLLAGIADGRLPSNLMIVLRRHPHGLPERWDRLQDHPAVRFDDPGPVGGAVRPGQVDIRDEQVAALCSTLAHTDVHVNVSSTLTLDGAFFDKPQIGPAYDASGTRRDRRIARELYEREHFLPIVASGALEIPRSPAELVAMAASALVDPGRLAPQRRAMLEALCTFTDFGATDRVAAEVLRFASQVPLRSSAHDDGGAVGMNAE